MTRGKAVPVTPSVLSWAIQQSGHSAKQVAESVKVSPGTLSAWVSGTERPNTTQFRALARKLKRTRATLLLPGPPRTAIPSIEFRHSPREKRTSLNPVELQYIRETSRIQRILAWMLREMDAGPLALPKVQINQDPGKAASESRSRINLNIGDQIRWRSSWAALHRWREVLESSGILIFSLPLGETSCRGFSLWDDYAPAIAVNTWWNYEARIFTLFHEYGHLLTRTNSACMGKAVYPEWSDEDIAERWCEYFSASFLMPWDAVRDFLEEVENWRPGTKIKNLEPVRRIARRFKVSLRAAALRLIEHHVADWELYKAIPPLSDYKQDGGGGGGRERRKIKQDEYGKRTFSLFMEALGRDVLTRSDVLTYLDVSDSDLDAIESGARR